MTFQTVSKRIAPVEVPSADERRHLTVLFCDLVSSTEIAAQLEPDIWRQAVAGYHRAAADVAGAHPTRR